jgi:hypothetical protein
MKVYYIKRIKVYGKYKIFCSSRDYHSLKDGTDTIKNWQLNSVDHRYDELYCYLPTSCVKRIFSKEQIAILNKSCYVEAFFPWPEKQ